MLPAPLAARESLNERRNYLLPVWTVYHLVQDARVFSYRPEVGVSEVLLVYQTTGEPGRLPRNRTPPPSPA